MNIQEERELLNRRRDGSFGFRPTDEVMANQQCERLIDALEKMQEDNEELRKQAEEALDVIESHLPGYSVLIADLRRVLGGEE